MQNPECKIAVAGLEACAVATQESQESHPKGHAADGVRSLVRFPMPNLAGICITQYIILAYVLLVHAYVVLYFQYYILRACMLLHIIYIVACIRWRACPCVWLVQRAHACGVVHGSGRRALLAVDDLRVVYYTA